MIPAKAFQWIVGGLAVLSLAHIGFKSVETLLQKEQPETVQVIENLQSIKSEIPLPQYAGLILFHPDSATPDPFYLMTAQYALAPTLLEYGNLRDTVLMYNPFQTFTLPPDYRKQWSSADKNWILATKDGSH